MLYALCHLIYVWCHLIISQHHYALWEVFTVLHRFLPESRGFWSIPVIPGELQFPFCQNGIGIPRMEWHLEWTGMESSDLVNLFNGCFFFLDQAAWPLPNPVTTVHFQLLTSFLPPPPSSITATTILTSTTTTMWPAQPPSGPLVTAHSWAKPGWAHQPWLPMPLTPHHGPHAWWLQHHCPFAPICTPPIDSPLPHHCLHAHQPSQQPQWLPHHCLFMPRQFSLPCHPLTCPPTKPVDPNDAMSLPIHAHSCPPLIWTATSPANWLVMPKSSSVQFSEDFCEPWTGPMVWSRQVSEPWTGPLVQVQFTVKFPTQFSTQKKSLDYFWKSKHGLITIPFILKAFPDGLV